MMSWIPLSRGKKDKTYHTCLRRQSDRFVMRVIIYKKKIHYYLNFLNFWKGIHFLPELIMDIFLLFIIFSYFLSWDSFITNYWTQEIKNRQHPLLKYWLRRLLNQEAKNGFWRYTLEILVTAAGFSQGICTASLVKVLGKVSSSCDSRKWWTVSCLGLGIFFFQIKLRIKGMKLQK